MFITQNHALDRHISTQWRSAGGVKRFSSGEFPLAASRNRRVRSTRSHHNRNAANSWKSGANWQTAPVRRAWRITRNDTSAPELSRARRERACRNHMRSTRQAVVASITGRRRLDHAALHAVQRPNSITSCPSVTNPLGASFWISVGHPSTSKTLSQARQ